MDKRYQVFISSTFADLEEVRREIMQNILELNCFPAGMEMFPATNGSQFEHIKKVIDQSDYYILIIAGRYGSVDEKGVSYTEREYDYAKSKGIPILVFARDNIDSLPVNKTDNDLVKRKKLEAFKNKAMDNRLAKLWSDDAKLPGEVFKSLSKLFDDEPRVGWVRADSIEEISKDAKPITISGLTDVINVGINTGIKDKGLEDLRYELEKERAYEFYFNNDILEIKITLLEVLKKLVIMFKDCPFEEDDLLEILNEFAHKEGDSSSYMTGKSIYYFERILVLLDLLEKDDSDFRIYYSINERVYKYIDYLILNGEY